jgi:protoporphyrinogen IX oxidase
VLGGLMLAVQDWSQGWLHAKLALVAVLAVVHHLYALWRKDFALDRNKRPARFYRIWNEVPTLAMIAIVILVIVKPF